MLAEWISEGTTPPSSADRRIEQITVEPRALKLRPGSKQQLLVTAHFNDGYREDVTGWVRFESTNSGTASVNDRGLVELKGSGEAGITTMYLSKVDVATVAVPFPNKVREAAFLNARKNNYVDPLVLEKLRALNIEPSEPAATASSFAAPISTAPEPCRLPRRPKSSWPAPHPTSARR